MDDGTLGHVVVSIEGIIWSVRSLGRVDSGDSRDESVALECTKRIYGERVGRGERERRGLFRKTCACGGAEECEWTRCRMGTIDLIGVGRRRTNLFEGIVS